MEKNHTKPLIPTRKLVLWVGIISIIMMFAGLTSGYIVRQAEGNWTKFQLPQVFWFSTVTLIVSSILLNMAIVSVKKGSQKAATNYLLGTFILGVLFIVLQYAGWSKLVDQGIYFTGNPSGSFLYVLTGLHVAHVVAGLIVLAVTLSQSTKQKYTVENYLGLQLCSIYWHFLGALWVYLFFFLLLIR